MNFFTAKRNLKKLSTLFITLLILSQNTYACDSYVVLGKDGQILVMISGDPHSCPRINTHEMVEEWCKHDHKDQTEKDQWLKACDEYFNKKELSWIDKLFSQKYE
jgi:hypothetical protein